MAAGAKSVGNIAWLLLPAFGLCPWLAAAQTVPRSVDAGALLKEYETRQTMPQYQASGAPPQVHVVAPQGSDKVTFILRKLVVEGSTIFSEAQLKPFYADVLDKQTSLKHIYEIAAEITQSYRSKGYVLATVIIPQQEIIDGVVTLQVVEGYIDQVSLDGDVTEHAFIQQAKSDLLAMRPFNVNTMESILLRLNDMPGMRVKATMEPLAPSVSKPGAVAARLTTQRKRVDASLAVDDYASRYLGTWQMTAQGAINGVIGDVDTLYATAIRTPNANYLQYYSLGYGTVLNASGLRLDIGARQSSTEPGYRLSTLDIESKAHGYWAALAYPLIRTRKESLHIKTKLNSYDSKTTISGLTFSEDSIRTVSLEAVYNILDPYQGSNLLDVELVRGLDVLGARKTGSPNLSNANGHSDFTSLHFYASRVQSLPENFQWFAALRGQLASTALLTSEQFSFGGPDFGRGYDISEINGDQGIAGVMELRYQGWSAEDYALQPFVFYDVGKVWQSGGAGGNPISAASAGVGMRYTIENTLGGNIFLAKPLTLSPATPKLGTKDGLRFGISLGVSY